MRNRLADHLTTWKAWYAVPAMFAIIIASLLPVVGNLLGAGDDTTVMALLVPAQFILFAVLALGVIGLLARKWPTTMDLGLKRSLGMREILLLIVVFVVSHVGFWLLTLGRGTDGTSASRYFDELGLGGALLPAALMLFASVVLAPVCEELLYRGAVMRPIHDALARRGLPVLAAVVSILASSFAFAMPHLGASLSAGEAAAFVLTGIAFGLVYLITGSMTATMVAHSLQSCFAFAQVLIFGAGDHEVSPLLYVMVFTCPIIVFLIARGLHAVLPAGRP
ncbi:MAG: type II CAAX endopeptidase family protein [Nesterenkonia sp.]|nr:type II CAAX endopeptidase family protein [Nesterenkonia sp.]